MVPMTSQLSDEQQCPTSCRCLDRSSVVVCSDVSHVPAALPASTLLLDLDHNRISLLPNSSFRSSTLRRLEILSVEETDCCTSSPGRWRRSTSCASSGSAATTCRPCRGNSLPPAADCRQVVNNFRVKDGHEHLSRLAYKSRQPKFVDD